MSNDTWLQIRVTKPFKEMLKKICGNRGMSKYIIEAVNEKIEMDRK